MRIKLFEGFVLESSLKKSIDDILVELGDIGLDWVVSQHKSVTDLSIIEVEITKEPTEVEDDDDFDWGYDAGREETNLFNFEDIYEPVMTLLAFMRDKYPDMKVEYYMIVNNNPETDDWFEEFLQENDMESVSLEDVKQFTNISEFEMEFTI